MIRIRVTAALLVACALLACGGTAGAVGGRPRDDLHIVYWAHGRAAHHRAHRWELTCVPAGGTHPHPLAACRELRLHRDELRPPKKACRFLVPINAPEVEVRGRLRTATVDRILRPACDGTAFRDLRALLTGRA